MRKQHFKYADYPEWVLPGGEKVLIGLWAGVTFWKVNGGRLVTVRDSGRYRMATRGEVAAALADMRAPKPPPLKTPPEHP